MPGCYSIAPICHTQYTTRKTSKKPTVPTQCHILLDANKKTLTSVSARCNTGHTPGLYEVRQLKFCAVERHCMTENKIALKVVILLYEICNYTM